MSTQNNYYKKIPPAKQNSEMILDILSRERKLYMILLTEPDTTKTAPPQH